MCVYVCVCVLLYVYSVACKRGRAEHANVFYVELLQLCINFCVCACTTKVCTTYLCKSRRSLGISDNIRSNPGSKMSHIVCAPFHTFVTKITTWLTFYAPALRSRDCGNIERQQLYFVKVFSSHRSKT